jgi:site-specific DNA-methyltransferase (adenine-specific)
MLKCEEPVFEDLAVNSCFRELHLVIRLHMNRLLFGDNLKWLRDTTIFPNASVDLVYLDPPFCGCGTTIHAAQKLGRQWIGIDVTYLAINRAV